MIHPPPSCGWSKKPEPDKVNNLIFIIYLYELYSKSKWESPGRDTTRFEFRCFENNIESLRYFKMTLPLFQVLQKSLLIPLSLCHIP